MSDHEIIQDKLTDLILDYHRQAGETRTLMMLRMALVNYAAEANGNAEEDSWTEEDEQFIQRIGQAVITPAHQHQLL